MYIEDCEISIFYAPCDICASEMRSRSRWARFIVLRSVD